MEIEEKSKRLYILAGVLLIIALAVAVNFMRNNLNQKINYNSDNVVADLLKSATVTYDRAIYYTLEDIIVNYIYSFDPESFYLEDQIGYEEYYEVLDETYRSKLGKAKYMETAKNFLKCVARINSSDMDSMTEYVTSNIIRTIYDLGEDKYLCLVGIENGTKFGYIGIKLDTANTTYNIFYLE